MSLFRVRDWWAAPTGSEEEFDRGCLCLANVDNAQDGQEKIVTGSFHGTLRIYLPHQRGYRVEDLMLEHRMDMPILQVLAGRFSPAEPKTMLAVLRPRKLVVYAVQAQGGEGANAAYYSLTKAYEHVLGVEGLHFTAHSMVAGPFGGVYNKDYLAVQSMDGQVSVFEHDRAAFTCKLPRCLVPGPLCYLAKNDLFITCTTEMCVEAYKYHALASASAARTGTGRDAGPARAGPLGGSSSSSSGAHGLRVEWSVNIGEHAVDIRTARFSGSLVAGQVDVLVLGEHSLFCLAEEGAVRMQKRLDFNASCAAAYARGGAEAGGATDNLLVGTHHGHLRVYRGQRLTWAARMEQVPVDLAVGAFAGLPGLVAAVDEAGTVTLNYMGTEPPASGVAAAESRDLDYEGMDTEHRRLLAVIRESQSEERAEPRDRVLLRLQTPSRLDDVDEAALDAAAACVDEGEREHLARSAHGDLVQATAQLFVTYTGSERVQNVAVAVDPPSGVLVREPYTVLPALEGGVRTPIVVPLVFWASTRLGVLPSLDFGVSASYTTAKGEPRVSHCEGRLPLALAARLVPPVKQAVFKFTLDTNREPVRLPPLFRDMLSQPGVDEETVARVTGTATNVLSFRYHAGVECTILVSKSAGRYRVQAPTLEALCLISRDLTRRLRAYFAEDEGEGALQVQYSEPLPLADFFVTIDQHFRHREAIKELAVLLDSAAHQFRVVQKRMLVRLKDRNPTPLNHLDALMNATYEQLQGIGSRMEAEQEAQRKAGRQLTCATTLMLLLMELRFGMDEEAAQVLRAHMSPLVPDGDGQGWEEVTDAGVTHLLRTVLSRSAKEAAAVAQEITMPKDTAKLKKHITILCDRLAKGGRLSAAGRGGEAQARRRSPADRPAPGPEPEQEEEQEPEPEPEPEHEEEEEEEGVRGEEKGEELEEDAAVRRYDEEGPDVDDA